MLKNIYGFILVIIISISIVFIIQHLKKICLKEAIIKKINSQTSVKYNISNDIRRITSNGYMPVDLERLEDSFKLVYEMNLECSICLEDLKEIHKFYNELSKIRKIAFFIIIERKSYDYIKFFIDQSLKNYDLMVAQKEFSSDNLKLYLLDNLNNIVMGGDIKKYPFLKNEYIKKIRKDIVIEERGKS